jgi:hypothetical protein
MWDLIIWGGMIVLLGLFLAVFYAGRQTGAHWVNRTNLLDPPPLQAHPDAEIIAQVKRLELELAYERGHHADLEYEVEVLTAALEVEKFKTSEKDRVRAKWLRLLRKERALRVIKFEHDVVALVDEQVVEAAEIFAASPGDRYWQGYDDGATMALEGVRENALAMSS